MERILIFGNTHESREAAQTMRRRGKQVIVCVTTEYARSQLPPGTMCHIGRFDDGQMLSYIRQTNPRKVIDATHPYAKRITESIAATCAGTDTEYLRLLRPDTAAPENAVFVEDAAGAAEYLDRVDGNILLTTGSRELRAFAAMHDFSERVYARVLPMEDSLRACREAGLPPAHILAMQGPFSEEMNLALLHQTRARYFVTKESGKAGGFEEKLKAAKNAGAVLIVIGRPQEIGRSVQEVCHFIESSFVKKEQE